MEAFAQNYFLQWWFLVLKNFIKLLNWREFVDRIMKT
jgi:hypothetical protein